MVTDVLQRPRAGNDPGNIVGGVGAATRARLAVRSFVRSLVGPYRRQPVRQPLGRSGDGDTADGGSAPNQRIAPPGAAGVLTNEKRMKGGEWVGGPSCACFLIKFLLTKSVLLERERV